MKINDSKNINLGNIMTGGGDVHLGDNYYGSLDYKTLVKNIARLKKFLGRTEIMEEKLELIEDLKEEEFKLKILKQGVITLAETFQKIEINTERLKAAKCFFDEGKFTEARAILDTEALGSEQEKLLDRKGYHQEGLAQINKDLKNNAAEYLVTAQLTALDFDRKDRFEKAMEYFELSLNADRNEENLFGYANFLQRHNQNNHAIPLYKEVLVHRNLMQYSSYFSKSYFAVTSLNLGSLYQRSNVFDECQKFYQKGLKLYRELVAHNPQTYLPHLVLIQHNMGMLYREKGEFDKAIKVQDETLILCQQLAEDNSEISLSHLGKVLDGQGLLRSKIGKFNQAETFHKKALKIRRQLAENGSQNYLTDFADTLTNLAVLQTGKYEFVYAEQLYKEALKIRRNLVKSNPQRHLPSLGETLINLGGFQKKQNELEKATQSYGEALELYRQLAKTNPETYLSYVAVTLLNFGNLQQSQGEFEKVEKSYEEALKIFRDLVERNQEVYVPHLAGTLFNLGNLQSSWGKFNRSAKCYNEASELFRKAEKSYQEALSLYRKLANSNLNVFGLGLISTLINLGSFFFNKRNDIQAMSLYEEGLNKCRELVQDNPQTYKSLLGLPLLSIGYYHSFKNSKKLAVEFLDEAVECFLPSLVLSSTKEYIKTTLKHLRSCGVDINNYLIQKYGKEQAQQLLTTLNLTPNNKLNEND